MTLSSCGFHFPEKNEEIIVNITGDTTQIIARDFAKSVRLSERSNYSIEFNNSSCSQNVVAYSSDGKSLGYNLECIANVKISNLRDGSTFDERYVSKNYLRKIASNKTESEEIERNYHKLRHNIIRRILRKLSTISN